MCICGFDCIYTVQLIVCPLMFPFQNGEGKLRAPKLLGAQSYFESKDTRGPELPGGSKATRGPKPLGAQCH